MNDLSDTTEYPRAVGFLPAIRVCLRDGEELSPASDYRRRCLEVVSSAPPANRPNEDKSAEDPHQWLRCGTCPWAIMMEGLRGRFPAVGPRDLVESMTKCADQPQRRACTLEAGQSTGIGVCSGQRVPLVLYGGTLGRHNAVTDRRLEIALRNRGLCRG